MRPKGKPQYGWTVAGHIVDLRKSKGRIYKGKDEIKLVTGEGWDDWYPVEPNEFKAKYEQKGLFQ